MLTMKLNKEDWENVVNKSKNPIKGYRASYIIMDELKEASPKKMSPIWSGFIKEIANNKKENKMTNLERLLRGDKSTYEGDLILKVLDFREQYPDCEENICIVDAEKDKPDSYWTSEKDINDGSEDIRFLEPEKPRTIEDGLVFGDIVVSVACGRFKVLGVCGEVVFLSYPNNFDKVGNFKTLSEIIELDFKLLQEPTEEETVEMTVEEISKKLGKIIKVVK